VLLGNLLNHLDGVKVQGVPVALTIPVCGKREDRKDPQAVKIDGEYSSEAKWMTTSAKSGLVLFFFFFGVPLTVFQKHSAGNEISSVLLVHYSQMRERAIIIHSHLK